MDLRDRTALITGGARRLGRAMAIGLADAGAKVAIHYRSSEDEAGQAVREIEASGGRATAVQGDLARPERAEEILAAAEAELGTVSILINNASIFDPRPFLEMSLADLRENQAIHTESALVLARSLALRLPPDATGAIVNLLDWRSSRPDPAYVPYGLSKSTLHAATAMLARALAPRIRVNGIAPGAILPPPGADGESEARHREIAGRTPLARSGSEEEIVRAALFLIRDADYTTGCVLPVDGGRHLQ